MPPTYSTFQPYFNFTMLFDQYYFICHSILTVARLQIFISALRPLFFCFSFILNIFYFSVIANVFCLSIVANIFNFRIIAVKVVFCWTILMVSSFCAFVIVAAVNWYLLCILDLLGDIVYNSYFCWQMIVLSHSFLAFHLARISFHVIVSPSFLNWFNWK